MAMAANNLLVELLVEELPPRALHDLGQAFGQSLLVALMDRRLVDPHRSVVLGENYRYYASPRRLAAWIAGVEAKAAGASQQIRLMPVAVGLDAAGRPTPALLKKLAALGAGAAAVPGLQRRGDGKTELLFLDAVVPGATLAEGLQQALEAAIAKLPIPKVMSYQLADGWSSVQFVRPAHGLVALHGAEVVPVSALGLAAGRETRGHRFEARAERIVLRDADSYEAQLAEEGAVIAGFDTRRRELERQLREAAAREGLSFAADEALLDEVCALVERPRVLVGRFDPAFLAVPQECLVLTMEANQKYFPLLDDHGRLVDRFLLVSNLESADPRAIVAGNERVLRARLADARFFYEQDCKTRLEARVERLAGVVHHNRLGSQLARVERIRKLAGAIAARLGAERELAERAAWLAKADLTTGMVGEFPELQGVMGEYYARHDGEPEAVARAIAQHYRPRYANDTLPEGNVAAAVALADRLDTLTGIWAVGGAPTGDKDPYALRRAALGVLRILAEQALPLDLVELLAMAAGQYPQETVAPSVVADLHAFMLERLAHWLRERGHPAASVEAVLALAPARIDLVLPKLAAVREFSALAEAASLAAADKRIRNILKKTAAPDGTADAALLREDAERVLFGTVNALRPEVDSLLAGHDYTGALTRLAGARAAVDRFFDEVMVMTDEPLLRNNRLALLRSLGELMNRVADLSRLAA
jgi:glycyl-tRNA synthetase beta chain